MATSRIATSGGVLLHQCERLLTVSRAVYDVAHPLEPERDQFEDVLLVVRDDDYGR
jgi:hypothetical protein